MKTPKVVRILEENDEAFSWCLIGFAAGLVLGLLVNGGDWPAVLQVIAGVVITGIITFVVTRYSSKVQLASTVWPERLKAHQEAFDLWENLTIFTHQKMAMKTSIRQFAKHGVGGQRTAFTFLLRQGKRFWIAFWRFPDTRVWQTKGAVQATKGRLKK